MATPAPLGADDRPPALWDNRLMIGRSTRSGVGSGLLPGFPAPLPGRPVAVFVTGPRPIAFGCGAPIPEEPQDEETDSTRLLRSLRCLCLGFVPTGDVVVDPRVALPVGPAHVKSLFSHETQARPEIVRPARQF